MMIDFSEPFGAGLAPPLATGPSVAIIGAGVCGMSAAAHLVATGVTDVTVIDAVHPAAGTSARSLGMVETQFIDAVDIAPRAYGRRFVEWLSRHHGLTWTISGYVRLAHTEDDLADFAASVEAQRALGVSDAAVLSPDELHARWPDVVVADRLGGLYGAGDGFVDGHEFCTILAELIRGAGASVRSRSALLEASQASSGRWHLRTSTGDVEADIVVNAAGPWAARVGKTLGADVPIEAHLHGAAAIDISRCRPRMLPMFMDLSIRNPAAEGLYFRSEGQSQLLAGLHVEKAGPGVSPDEPLGPLSETEIDRVVGALLERMTGLDDAALLTSWTGLYPVTPDLHPVVGHHPANESVVCAVGAAGSGIQLAAAIGAVSASAVVGTATNFANAEKLWNPDRALVASV